MKLKLSIVEKCSEDVIPVYMVPMTAQDAKQTLADPVWQSDWTSNYINSSKFSNFALKTEDNETVALSSYEYWEHFLVVHIAYAESAPSSNPTQTSNRKYFGIGKAIIAYGIQLSVNAGFGGAVMFEAKTTELLRHYKEDFCALPLPMGGQAGPQKFLIDGETAIRLIADFLE